MTDYNTALLAVAEQAKGITEWPGAQHNPQILEMFEAAGHTWVEDDETPWCAAFVAWCCTQIGVDTSGKLNARSYLDWGEPVSLADARPGDVVVFWRGRPNGWQGHVALLVSFNGNTVTVRGGNQGNQVSDAEYPMDRVLGFRRAVAPSAVRNNRPTLRMGDRGAFVLDLQDILARAGYHLGVKDGQFGPATRSAVLAFQADHGLVADGIVGAKTWAALLDAPQRQFAETRPQLTEDDLRERGSRTIAVADKAEEAAEDAAGGAKTLAGVATAAGAFLGSDGAADKLAAAEGLLDKAIALLATYWPLIMIVAITWLILTRAKRVKQALSDLRANRVEDARTGAHLGR